MNLNALFFVTYIISAALLLEEAVMKDKKKQSIKKIFLWSILTVLFGMLHIYQNEIIAYYGNL